MSTHSTAAVEYDDSNETTRSDTIIPDLHYAKQKLSFSYNQKARKDSDKSNLCSVCGADAAHDNPADIPALQHKRCERFVVSYVAALQHRLHTILAFWHHV